MPVEWNDRLAVGYGKIDEQHQELFRRFSALLDACQARRGRESIEELLEFLDDYVVNHFREEEELMDRHSYPASSSHKEAHGTFIRQLSALKETLRNRGATLDLVIKTNQTLLDWIISHIKNVDVQLGSFLQSRAG